MLGVEYPFWCNFCRRYDSSVVCNIELGKGLHSPHDCISKNERMVKKNIFIIFLFVFVYKKIVLRNIEELG